ncbi:protein kinase [Nocardiopsis sp. NPDC050513]|uniref:protein kinase domain-containing protein n=1 Tax=Nocardiopsis sp. NPDC050513 TaxID=3364338 RepID=UPI00379E1AF4
MRRNGRREEPASPVPGTHSLTTLYRGDDAVLYQGELDFDGASVVAKVLGSRPIEGRRDETGLWEELSLSPGVQPLLGAGTTEAGWPYLLMEYAPDGSYEDFLRRGTPIPVDEAVRVGAAIARALAAVHGLDLLHHAVTPANILRTDAGPTLIDFGSALPTDHPFPPVYHSRATLRNAPPEELRGARPSPASDVYRLASTVWTLLAGRAPFDDEDAPVGLEEYRTRLLTAPVSDLPREDVPDWLNAVLRRALVKDPDQRIPSAEEFAEALRLERSPSGPDPDAGLVPASDEPASDVPASDESAEEGAEVEADRLAPVTTLGETAKEDQGETPWWEEADATAPEDERPTEPDAAVPWWEDPDDAEPEGTEPTPVIRPAEAAGDAPWWERSVGTEPLGEPSAEPDGELSWWEEPEHSDPVGGTSAEPDGSTGADDASADGVSTREREADGEPPWWEDPEPGPAPAAERPAPAAPPEVRTPSGADGNPPAEPEDADRKPAREAPGDAVPSGPATPAPSHPAPPPPPPFGRPEPPVRPAEPVRPRAQPPAPAPWSAGEPADWRPSSGIGGDPTDPDERRTRLTGVLTLAGLVVLVVVTLGAGGYVLVSSFASSGAPENAPSDVAEGGESTEPAVEEGEARPETGADIAPTDVAVVDESFSVSLTWTDNTGGDTPHYVVGGPVGGASSSMADVESGAAEVEISGLNPTVEYCFRVVAVESAEVLAPSAEVCTDRS